MTDIIDGIVIPKYPDIKVSFSGSGGGIQVCLSRFHTALVTGGLKKQDIDQIIKRATSSDKDEMFRVIAETVTIID
jgi:hypothetical protein